MNDNRMSQNNERVVEAIRSAAADEAYAKRLGIVCEEVRPGYARLSMTVTDEMLNLFGMAHGGAIFSLMDDAFQIACNSHGVSAFALNVSVTYVRGAKPGDRLVAVADEAALTARTGSYEVKVSNGAGEVIALAQALAYRKKEPPPFL